MREALAPLQRYIATSAVARRFHFVWCDPSWCPSNRTIVFALDTDFHMGILTSAIHVRWAMALGGTFEDRPHYTHTSAFETFPWPASTTAEARETVGALAAEIIRRRQEICVQRGIGLTTLYNEIDEGAYADLRNLHHELDRAVATAYGWPATLASDPVESNRRLLDLNRQIAAGEIEYDPFVSARSPTAPS